MPACAAPAGAAQAGSGGYFFFSEKKTFYLDFRHPFRGESNPPGRHQAPTRKRRGGRPPRKEAARVPLQYFPPAAGMKQAGVSLRDFPWLPQREVDGDCPPQPLTARRRTIRRSLVARFPPFRGPRRKTDPRRTQDEPKTDPKWTQNSSNEKPPRQQRIDAESTNKKSTPPQKSCPRQHENSLGRTVFFFSQVLAAKV